MEKEEMKGLSRRDFIKAAGATAAGVAAGSLMPEGVFAAPTASPRVIGANDRINVAFVGVGGMGGGHLHSFRESESAWNVTCGAVCDVWEKRRREAQGRAGCPGSMVFGDYRRLLENKDIDAVVVATPDHWHAPVSIAAMEAGKHVYVEKPMTHTLQEAFKMWDTAKRTKAIVQVGSQGCSDAKWHTAGKAIRDGKIGTVLCAQGSYCRNNPQGEWNYWIDPDMNESNCDWKMWLGNAPKRAFSPDRYFRWRKYWDYGTGIIGDLWPHRLHPLLIAMSMTDQFPKRVACLGAICCDTDKGNGEPRDVADTTMMVAEFPNGAQIYLLGSTVNERGIEDMIRGQKASLFFGGGRVEIRPERPFSDEVEEEAILVIGPGEDHNVHRKNWLDAIRSNSQPNCGIDLGVRVQTIVSMAEMSYRQSRMMNFDAKKMKLI
ncbi:MAG: Gfo/Idh/MocA family oxidoreductase [Armatimonadetes bacterium]|nr:Gfo/Idh/MocA family oxidoreductase [Armatimonadota bacterium]